MIALGAAFWAGAVVGGATAFWVTVWLLSQEGERGVADEADRWLRAHTRARR